MKRVIGMMLLAGCAVDAPTPELSVEQGDEPLIYGADDRREAYELQSAADIALARSTAAVVSAGRLSATQGGFALDVSTSFGAAYNLCTSEPYRAQPSTADCTAFVVGDDLLATAGHCISGATCGSTRFVFGFEMIDAGTVRAGFPSDDVYACAQVVGRQETSTEDYAVVRTDRPIVGHPALPIRRSGSIALGTSLRVSGHPAGIPLKVAGGAQARGISHPNYFEANLDTYGGNSGSPVVNDQGVVEGILVRGNTDFVQTGKGRRRCNVSNQCNDSGCPGWEDVTRATRFAAFVPDGPQCAADADCTDGNACNGVETCSGGRCEAGAPPSCDDGGDQCTQDLCADLGDDQFACQNPPVSCDDGDPCTVDSCDPAGGCRATPVSCGAGQVCQGGLCIDPPQCLPKNAACDSDADCCSGTCHHRKRTCR